MGIDDKSDKKTRPKRGHAHTATGEWRDIFIENLAKMGVVDWAAKASQVSSVTCFALRKNDPEFAARWKDAIRRSADAMEAEAWRRAVKGVAKPVYQGGKKRGTIQEYSDTLLIFLLKGARPERFRDNYSVEHSGKRGRPLKVSVTHEFDYDSYIQSFVQFARERMAGERRQITSQNGDRE